MDRKKQIEEMEKVIGETFTYAKKWYPDKYEPFELEVYPDEIARTLYNAGYRKESETAREILECLRFLIEERNCVGGYDLEDETIDGTIFVEILNELKERYGVELE